MTYHLKAIFPFSGILALENISSDISTFHISRDLCNFFFFIALRRMSDLVFISARRKIKKESPNLLKLKSYSTQLCIMQKMGH